MSLNKLVENYLQSSYRTSPVRSPFSQGSYYSSNYVSGGSGSWLDLTDLYNTTYKTHHMEEGFNKVMYNEPLNIMVMWPKDGAEDFEHIEEDCVAQFGLKTARGYRKDYRFLDQSIPGAGKVAMSEEDADRLVQEPFESLREVRPTYTRNLGETPVERIDENKNVEKAKNIQRRLHKLIRERVDKELEEERNYSVDLTEEESEFVRTSLRRLQLEGNLTRLEDAIADVAAAQVRKQGKISEKENRMIAEAIKQNG